MPTESSINIFINAFRNRLGRTPYENIHKKIDTGSQIDDIRYLFNIIAAEISRKNNCKYFDFDYFYMAITEYKPKTNSINSRKTERPENAGKFWSKDEEQLLIEMYNSKITKKEICDTLKRTENGLAARLLKLGIIDDVEIFIKSE